YFDTDLTIMKFFGMPHWEGGKLGIGAQFFNILNHPNFDQPIRDLSNTSQFGQIVRTVNTPTSILGSFLGGDASPRLIELTAKFNFYPNLNYQGGLEKRPPFLLSGVYLGLSLAACFN